jgi:hypothetical protein
VSEKMDEGLQGLSHDGISRRRMLKRIGAGAAIAWSAPVLTSLRTPAFAQVSPGACPAWNCGDPITECGGTPCGLGPCVCDVDTEGKPFCWDNIFCSDGATPCSSSSECPSGWRCSTNCCGQTCLPECGTCGPGGSLPSRKTAGRSAAGR